MLNKICTKSEIFLNHISNQFILLYILVSIRTRIPRNEMVSKLNHTSSFLNHTKPPEVLISNPLILIKFYLRFIYFFKQAVLCVIWALITTFYTEGILCFTSHSTLIIKTVSLQMNLLNFEFFN